MMITSALLVALCCVCAHAVSTLTAANDDTDCALYLSGPGRTSAYDYSINLLKGNFGYEGQHNCITYEAINQAYLEGRNRILVAQPKGDWKPEDFGSVGELILDISINLARRYGLTYEEIEKGLPLIDTSRTLIREVCPPVFSHVECRAGKYRRFDGLCNNLQHPTWGATMAPFQRLIGPLFADGINSPRISHTGHDLPLSRVVSRTMHPDDGFHDHAGTVMVIAWGQFMDHDYTLTGTPLDPVNRNDPEECCKRPPHLKHPYCNEIRIPDDDYFYKLWGVKCIDFVRGFPSPRPGCRLGSRVPFNTLTGSIDGNTVYGVTEKFARKLRTGFGGLLRMNPVFKEYGLKDLLPLKLDIPDEGCTRPNKNMYCFEAGEIRVNEQLVLTVMHTLMAREHNRVATALAEVNPHWDDETLFQESRRINIAEIQHITYNEFLPILLGKDVMEKFGLVLEKGGYWDGYDPEVNPDVLASFAAAAYRFGHSLLPTAVERWSKAHKFIASKRLSDLIRRPYDLYRAGVLDEYVMGLMNQVAQAMDDSITQEVTNHLFKKVGARFGMDLVSFNMQRGREFGLPGYMEFRKFCGLPWADDFQGLFGSMPNQTVRKYESIFEHPVDVDLWSGGVSERPLPGSMLGPTFACVIATQFSYSRRGDRFWFELPNQPSSFTSEQLVEIRKARLARVICDNTDIIDTVQLYPMVLPDHELNPRVPCRSGIIPSMDFSKWAEPQPFQGSAKQFITDAFIVEKNKTNSDTGETECGKQHCSCNGTANANNSSLHCNNATVEAHNISVCSNSTKNLLNTNCSIHNDTNQDNKIPDGNTVLKYVYKKNDKKHSIEKTKGHVKNSLKRRKRSTLGENTDTLDSSSTINNSPLIVDYETSHRPRGKITWLTSPDNPNIIRGSDLADFHIHTRHENLNKNEDLPRNSNRRYTEADHLNDKPQTYNQREEYSDNNSNKNSNYKRDDKEDEQNDRKYRKSAQLENIEHDSESDERSRERGERRDSEERNHENGERNHDSEEQDRDTGYHGGASGDRSYNSGERSRESEERSIDDGERSHEKGESNRESSEHKSNDSAEHPKPSQNSEESHERIENKKPYSNSVGGKENLDYHFKPRYSDNIESQRSSQEDSKEGGYRPEIEPYDPRPLNLPVVKLSNDKDFPHPELFNKDIKVFDSRPLKLSEVQLPNAKEFPHPESFTKDIKAFDSRPLNLPEVKLPNGKDFPYPESFAKEIKAFDSRPLNFHRPKLYNENSQEMSEENRSQINQDENRNGPSSNLSSHVPFQKGDTGDFSYERIQVNENGHEVPKKKPVENVDPKSAVEILPSNAVRSGPVKHDTIQTEDTPSNENYRKEPVNINDGEVKPVIEISGENSSGDISEESEANDGENKSLESVLGVKINGLSDKIVSRKEDVKQQFERIPLNYQHDVDKNKKLNKEIEKTVPQKDENTDLIKNDGTIDTFAPDNVQYDENLNIKFDDVTVKLPEIKLPDDILAYTRENSPFKDELDDDTPLKKPFYNYNNDEDKEIRPPVNNGDNYNNDYRKNNPKNHKKEDSGDDEVGDETDHAYYGPYYEGEKKSQDYKKEETEEEGDEEDGDEDEDLYEKFVRERFGKQGTFEKRSEQLQETTEAPLNPHLYKTIQNILNKTAEIEKQAEESGDPKAGYMWTLEYGENL